jgi:3-phenylpropionate/cinnamic acid dioxygenase small subunit
VTTGLSTEPELTARWTELATRLLATEAYLLDARRYEEWIELFLDDGVYWIPLERSAEDPGESLNIAFEGPPRMRQRVARLRSGIAHAQEPPSSTVHSYSGILVTEASPAEATVESALVVVESRFSEQNVVAARCRHRLVRDEAGAVRIALKRIELAEVEQALSDLSFVP